MPSKRVKKVRLRKRRAMARIVIAVFLIVFVFSVIVFFAHSDRIRIADVSIRGNKVVSEKELKKEIEKILSGKYLFLFPKDNVLAYPKRSIKARLLDEFKRLDRVDIRLVDLTSIEVIVSERKPFALWCGDTYDDVVDEDSATRPSTPCYFVDKDGYVFAEAPDFSESVYLEFYGGNVSDVPIGSYLLSPKGVFGGIMRFVSHLESIDIDIGKVFIDDDGNRIFFIKTPSGRLARLYVHADNDFERVFYDIRSALTIKLREFDGDIAALLNRLEYMDLRFEDKVFFKFAR